MKKEIDKFADKLVIAYKKNKLISPLPIKYTKNIKNATRLRKICESKIKTKIVGFKAGGTALPVLKKLREKEPFYSAIFKNNVLINDALELGANIGLNLDPCKPHNYD